jgi:hypothetical protein
MGVYYHSIVPTSTTQISSSMRLSGEMAEQVHDLMPLFSPFMTNYIQMKLMSKRIICIGGSGEQQRTGRNEAYPVEIGSFSCGTLYRFRGSKVLDYWNGHSRTSYNVDQLHIDKTELAYRLLPYLHAHNIPLIEVISNIDDSAVDSKSSSQAKQTRGKRSSSDSDIAQVRTPKQSKRKRRNNSDLHSSNDDDSNSEEESRKARLEDKQSLPSTAGRKQFACPFPNMTLQRTRDV